MNAAATSLVGVADVLEHQRFDEIIVSTFRAPGSRWLRMDLPSEVARTFELPVVHVVVSTADAS